MHRGVVETALLVAFALVFLGAGGFLLVRSGGIASGYGRQRVVVAGLVGMLLGGVLLYESTTR